MASRVDSKLQSVDLTDLQKELVAQVLVTPTATVREIAGQLGCSFQYVSKCLNNQHVKEAIRSTGLAELALSTMEAVSTQRSLLSARSEYVQHQAATDILNRNNIGNSDTNNAQQVTVNIDLS